MEVSPEILNLVPYKPGKPISEAKREFGLQSVIKLASNENPLGASTLAMRALVDGFSEAHNYPDPSGFELIHKIQEKWGWPAACVGLGNGSDEIFDLLIRIFCEKGDAILIPKYSFAAYKVSAHSSRIRVIEQEVDSEFEVDLDQLAHRFESSSNDKIKMIFLANPNNPTGNFISATRIQKFLQRLKHRDDVLIVVDEAYNEFVNDSSHQSAFSLFEAQGNLIVTRTFSKAYGLAGFRVGAMVAPSQVIDLYHRVRKPFNMNHLGQLAAKISLEDLDFLKRTQQITWDGLIQVAEGLTKLGLRHWKSAGNFILFDTGFDSSVVDLALLKKGIILRPVKNYGLETHMRFSIGKPEDNAAALKALGQVLTEWRN
ncbi:MAG: histidinol-phosphate transaminase [Pseudobdellovibrionaceae bacterium]